jgi:hypothetical protein
VRAAASLVVHSAEEPPDALSTRIGLQPHDAWRKGEERRPGRQYPTNAVVYESGLDESHSPTEHAAALAELLRPAAEAIRVVVDSGATAVVRIVEHSTADNVEAWVKPGDLRTFAEMGAAVGFDYYVSHEDD